MLTHIRNLEYVILISAEMTRMKAFYHEILGFPIQRDWDYGHRTVFFKDPDGNILEIYAEI